MDDPASLTPARVTEDLLRPLSVTTWRFYAFIAVLVLLVLNGAIAWGVQLWRGIGMAGINRPVGWGIYIATFVFWIGISHSGTMVSAILRLTRAEWRRPVTRAAEAMTIFSVLIAALFPIIHLGRAWVFYYLLPYPSERGIWPNFRSPLLWDATAIGTYVIGSILFLYTALLPDLALARDTSTGWRRALYRLAALGWRGRQEEWSRLKSTMLVLSVVIIPVAVSVHSIVSWDFGMTLVPGWHSTVFAPLFVIGAIHSGLAAVVTIMVVLRTYYHLEAYITPDHFNNVGRMQVAVTLLWTYLTFAEFLTVWYGSLPGEMAVLRAKVDGAWLVLFGAQIAGCFLVPFVVLTNTRLRRIPAVMLVTSLAINVGMYIERVLIIVPSLAHPRTPFVWGGYFPSWVEVSIVTASFAGFALLLALFTKVVPALSVWEVKEGLLARGTRRIGRAVVPAVAEVE